MKPKPIMMRPGMIFDELEPLARFEAFEEAERVAAHAAAAVLELRPGTIIELGPGETIDDEMMALAGREKGANVVLCQACAEEAET